mmetsp:Transcript_28387/g.90828  ORF Transcript_28387/g.90828 Transcript_28387/m.90828 type:complete len:203 (+) Transcript_28387:201-809(+)
MQHAQRSPHATERFAFQATHDIETVLIFAHINDPQAHDGGLLVRVLILVEPPNVARGVVLVARHGHAEDGDAHRTHLDLQAPAQHLGHDALKHLTHKGSEHYGCVTCVIDGASRVVVDHPPSDRPRVGAILARLVICHGDHIHDGHHKAVPADVRSADLVRDVLLHAVLEVLPEGARRHLARGWGRAELGSGLGDDLGVGRA